MKKYLLPILASLVLLACDSNNKTQSSTEASAPPAAGQSGVKDDESQKDVVKVAVGSPDHTSLVKAIQAAELVDALSNAGPFTVFAPTNAAFDKLPAGTVEGLLKPEKKDALTDILGYHTYVGVLKTSYLSDGQKFEQVNGGYVTIGKKDGKVTVNGSEIVASIPTSNGIIHVINDVLLPPSK